MQTSLVAVLALGLGCVSARQGAEPRPETPESAPAAPIGDEPELAEAPAPEQPEPEPEPEPETTDSALVAGAQIDASVAAGLALFATELDDAVEGQGALWVGPLEGNGGRDVLVYIPPDADRSAPFELVFHFHGTYSEVVDKRRPDMKKKREWIGWERLSQTIEAITELQGTRPANVALVYPISAGKRLEPGHRGWSNIAYDLMWMDPVQPPDYRDDFAKLYDEVAEVLGDQLGVHPSKIPDTVIAEGHSAGGVALLNIALNGSDHVREYIFLDASFQSWADGTYAAIKDTGAAATMTVVQTDKGMCDPFEGRTPWCVDTEAWVELWKQHRSWCASRPDETVADSDWTCAELEAIAEAWVDGEQAWCAAMADGMASIPEVTLVETKVYHKDMPRTFGGGLGLD